MLVRWLRRKHGVPHIQSIGCSFRPPAAASSRTRCLTDKQRCGRAHVTHTTLRPRRSPSAPGSNTALRARRFGFRSLCPWTMSEQLTGQQANEPAGSRALGPQAERTKARAAGEGPGARAPCGEELWRNMQGCPSFGSPLTTSSLRRLRLYLSSYHTLVLRSQPPLIQHQLSELQTNRGAHTADTPSVQDVSARTAVSRVPKPQPISTFRLLSAVEAVLGKWRHLCHSEQTAVRDHDRTVAFAVHRDQKDTFRSGFSCCGSRAHTHTHTRARAHANTQNTHAHTHTGCMCATQCSRPHHFVYVYTYVSAVVTLLCLTVVFLVRASCGRSLRLNMQDKFILAEPGYSTTTAAIVRMLLVLISQIVW